jgi:hypothetical protein
MVELNAWKVLKGLTPEDYEIALVVSRHLRPLLGRQDIALDDARSLVLFLIALERLPLITKKFDMELRICSEITSPFSEKIAKKGRKSHFVRNSGEVISEQILKIQRWSEGIERTLHVSLSNTLFQVAWSDMTPDLPEGHSITGCRVCFEVGTNGHREGDLEQVKDWCANLIEDYDWKLSVYKRGSCIVRQSQGAFSPDRWKALLQADE